ncbi:MAG TPA: carboxy-S-adenosyl-L-methionine synthase CmoA [Gammaproteobacteria bacterium]|nr:carboxy-S-adenosyl-L-methionine synthase CmoA [Gammaproteobacteria bacterium]
MNTEDQRDRLFRQRAPKTGSFDFGPETARVFDDMVARSVPCYDEIQRMIAEIAADFATPGSAVYDLGCSTGAAFPRLDRRLPPQVRLVGVDASPAMLARARARLQAAGLSRPVTLECRDLNEGLRLEGASVAILNLTLQFIRPLRRAALIRDIAAGLPEGGCLILVEKVLSPHSLVNSLYSKYHHDFKRRNGYDELEITRKREALENVLVPYHAHENEALLLDNGFRSCDGFFRWYNFCGLLAIR